MHNEEGGLRELKTHSRYWRQEEQREVSSNLSNKLMKMGGRVDTGRNGKRISVASNYKG